MLLFSLLSMFPVLCGTLISVVLDVWFRFCRRPAAAVHVLTTTTMDRVMPRLHSARVY